MASTMIQPPTGTLRVVNPEELETAREAGREVMRRAASEAPQHPLLRIAWAQGARETDTLQTAVDEARALGILWEHIARATGERDAKAAEHRYGGGMARQRAYRQRQRQKELGGDTPS